MRALEASRPDAAWFQRLVRSPGDSILGSVREFFTGFEAVISADQFEEGIENETIAILELIESLLHEEGLSGFIRAGYDFDNMTHLWKAMILGREPYLNRFGLVPPETVEQAVRNGVIIWLPEYLKRMHERLLRFESADDAQSVEYEGESLKWRFLLDSAPGEGARRYTVNRIDLRNLKSFIRFRRTGLRRARHGGMWIAGGEIEAQVLDALMKEPEDEMYNYLGVTSYRGLVRKGLDRNTPLWKVGALFDAQLLEMIGESRYRFFDLMPVIYHIQMRERESSLLRQIFTGKINNLPEKIIMERIEAVIS